MWRSTGDFTYDLWLKRAPVNGTMVRMLGSSPADGSVSVSMGFDESDHPQAYINVGGFTAITSAAVQKDLNWHHYALVKNGSNYLMFWDGNITATLTTATAISAGGTTFSVGRMGEYNGLYYTGYVDEFRYSNISRWVANFTPPTAEYSLDGVAPASNFTSTPNPSTNLTEVQFTDTSTNTPTSWAWTFGDANYTANTTQNPKHFYSGIGTYSVCLNATNAYGSNTTCADQSVVNASGWNQQDVWMEGQYNITVYVTDATSGAPLANTSLSISDGKTGTTDSFGYAFITEGFGIYSMYVTKDGYAGKSVSFIVDGDQTVNVQLSTSTSALPVDIPGTPKDVKFHVTSFFGAPIPNAVVYAQGISTSHL